MAKSKYSVPILARGHQQGKPSNNLVKTVKAAMVSRISKDCAQLAIARAELEAEEKRVMNRLPERSDGDWTEDCDRLLRKLHAYKAAEAAKGNGSNASAELDKDANEEEEEEGQPDKKLAKVVNATTCKDSIAPTELEDTDEDEDGESEEDEEGNPDKKIETLEDYKRRCMQEEFGDEDGAPAKKPVTAVKAAMGKGNTEGSRR